MTTFCFLIKGGVPDAGGHHMSFAKGFYTDATLAGVEYLLVHVFYRHASHSGLEDQ